MLKMEFWTSIYTTTKFNLKWIKDLSISTEQTPRRKNREKFLNISLTMIFFIWHQSEQE